MVLHLDWEDLAGAPNTAVLISENWKPTISLFAAAGNLRGEHYSMNNSKIDAVLHFLNIHLRSKIMARLLQFVKYLINYVSKLSDFQQHSIF